MPKRFTKTLKQEIIAVTANAVTIEATALVTDIQNKGIAPRELDKCISYTEMLGIQKEILNKLKEFDSKRRLPYHNVKHSRSVFNRVVQLTRGSDLARSDIQLIKLAALFHDYVHGFSFSHSKLKHLSFEEQSAVYADKYGKKIGLSTRQRIVVYGLIISTTFSKPHINPDTRLEKILVIADLGGFINSSKDWLLESWQVTQEIPFSHRPGNLKQWLREQERFLDYVKMRLTPESIALGWHLALEKKFSVIKRLMKNLSYYKPYVPLVKKIRQTLPTAV
ncbi:MAG: HD domain-containing protein [Fibrobacteria bacterium]|nr:HD domain-containing protein [Fibrobacteria bacterium]